VLYARGKGVKEAEGLYNRASREVATMKKKLGV